MLVLWVVSPSERHRRNVVGQLEVGDSAARVVERLGEPPVRCDGTSIEHLEGSFPPGWPPASAEVTLQRLGEETRERWVYPVNPRNTATCAPRDDQTEVGVGRDGRLVWFIAITGKTTLRFPARFSPADPEGAAGS